MTNSFIERYKSYTTIQLIDIIDNKDSYEPLAIESARLELVARNLTDEQLNVARKSLEVKRQEKVRQKEKIEIVGNRVKSFAAKTLNEINPASQKPDEKIIKGFCAFLVFVWLYSLYTDFRVLYFSLTNSRERDIYDFNFYLFFVPYVLVPTAAILFWLRKKIGWTLSSIYLTFTTFTFFYTVIYDLRRSPFAIPAFEKIFPHIDPITYIGMIILFGGSLIVVSKQSIREIYSVNKQHMFCVIGSVALLVTFQWWNLLMK